MKKDQLLERLRSGASLSGREQLTLTFLLALPAILAQLSMCLMSYIDAAMVGRLGSAQAAAIGLVSSSVWILGSFCYGNASGFSVQIAHRCGAKDFSGAKKVFRHGIVTTGAAGLLLALLGIAISPFLPHWLGGSGEIVRDASDYFFLYSLSFPFFQLAVFSEAVLIASGNVKVPSLTSVAMCVLDVAFNALFIFGLGMGVKGAALGTGIATACSGIFLTLYAFTHSPELKHRPSFLTPVKRIGSESRSILGKALNISWPLWLQNVVVRGAYIMATVLIAPLGTVAIAANSFAIIAEGFCYLPGFGMQDAATTLVGQSLGAGRTQLARRFAFITISCGSAMMGLLALLMWGFAPEIMGLLTPDPEVIASGAQCLRIVAWAECFFGISIVAYIFCMWVVRIGLAILLIPRLGLSGYWIAMATDLIAKGIIFALRIRGKRWLREFALQH